MDFLILSALSPRRGLPPSRPQRPPFSAHGTGPLVTAGRRAVPYTGQQHLARRLPGSGPQIAVWRGKRLAGQGPVPAAAEQDPAADAVEPEHGQGHRLMRSLRMPTVRFARTNVRAPGWRLQDKRRRLLANCCPINCQPLAVTVHITGAPPAAASVGHPPPSSNPSTAICRS